MLRIRSAITDIQRTIPLANIHPGTKLSGIGLGAAAMEAEGLDSHSQERVFAALDLRAGSRLGIISGLQTYGCAKEAMTDWVERLVKQLDEAHGRVRK